MDPSDLLAELVLGAETAQLVEEVDAELERLAQTPTTRRQRRAELRELESAVDSWMRV